jgi:uncharacterized glyoxalase superfamily protein PhnB
MPNLAKGTRSSVIPVLRYREASAAIEWLCAAFGFEKNLVVPNEDGTIAHDAIATTRFSPSLLPKGSTLS